MRASDEHFYNINRLHVLFALSTIALLAVTVWMVAADHWREWKVYQRTYRDRVEPWFSEARLREEESQSFRAIEEELRQKLDDARSIVPEKEWEELRRTLFEAKQAAEQAERRLQLRRAEFDEARSAYESGVGKGADSATLERLQHRTTTASQDVERLAAVAETASLHHETLTDQLNQLTHEVIQAEEALATHRAGVERLSRTLTRQKPSTAKRVLSLPIIDAFGRPLAIDQIWLPELTLDYHFREVARFDRCTTCHQGIDQRAFEPKRVFTARLTASDEKESPPIEFAAEGVLEANTPTVGRVLPKTPAAMARLLTGDVIESIDGTKVESREQAIALLRDDEKSEFELTVRRGLPHPHGVHPRLDLFVGSTSPHPKSQFGCTICHDGQGRATEFKFASHAPNDPNVRRQWQSRYGWFQNEHWDLPMLPTRFAESRCLKCHHDPVALEPSHTFPEPPAPKLVAGYHLVRQMGCFGCHEIKGVDTSGRSIGPDMRLESASGTLRKVGPSLRHVAEKLDGTYLVDFVANPIANRPASRMPRLFGLHDHLDGQSLDDAKRFEAVEIRAMTAYLLGASETYETPEKPLGAIAPGAIERGKNLFHVQGCLACHKHPDFPKAVSTFGPDLSKLSEKLVASDARYGWLPGWIRDPSKYSPRTRMPALLLEPIAPNNATTDPAFDVTAYLLSGESRKSKPLPMPVENDLDALALLHLSKTFGAIRARKYLERGIPQASVDETPGDAQELLEPITLDKKLRYVGRRTIRKRGCFGCHDIPGTEDAQPIGPALSDWGRRAESLLAFEQVHRFVTLDQPKPPDDPDQGYFREALFSNRREGFLWQKLHQPRSFDFKKTENKGYNERLMMGRFSLTDDQVEAVMTFVLGLVARPPVEKYIDLGDRNRQAIVAGRGLIRQYGCAECHVMGMERWQFEYDPELFEEPFALPDFDFVATEVDSEQKAQSMEVDRRGFSHGEVVGMPRWDASGNLLEDFDDDDNPLYFFTLWEPTTTAGLTWQVGGAEIPIAEPQIVEKRPPWGGAFARLLFPTVLDEARQSGASAVEMEAWGWLPPSLVNEGALVQPDWLNDYLLDPFAVRPAAVLRMPRYKLSPQEARTLVDYFAATAGVEFPYTTSGRERIARFDSQPNEAETERFDAAMRIVIDRTTYCAKCHLIGDFGPGGETRTILAPRLDRVGRRIRPEYLRRWLANPKSVVPYTGMPVNFPPDGPPMGQDLMKGSSLQQLDAVVDLLLNFDEYLAHRASIRRMAEPPEESEAGGETETTP